ncbi:hypothetical protein IUY40_09335 [Flavobacterium sp. ALJ2]|uniref:hypothetical protein n=1 Tax=Flavobacterium sp. ALJ2 TaxID=2786960 RepID=UPI00189D8847|nr:hypothetical protein [Flavobacterium sp. ALJ2]MBF7091744.1 hypothetical protein [Flavobacterium sp. ALJ2]
MKKITLLICTILFALCFTNCKEKKYFEEIVSEKDVSITKLRFAKDKEKDDLIINIPVEFNLYLNDFPNIRRVNIYYENNHHPCVIVQDFLINESQTDKTIFTLDDFKYPNYPKSIYLVEQKMKISKEEAQQLIKKYNPKTAVENIKSIDDTIPLVSYKKFREDNPKFIEELRRIPDSIKFVIKNRKEKKTIQIKEKINW